jgi:hypothetical protein
VIENFLSAPPALWAIWAVFVVGLFAWLLRIARRKPMTSDTDPAPPPVETRPPAKACLVTGAPATHPRPVAVTQRPWWSLRDNDDKPPPELCERAAKAYAIELERFLDQQEAALKTFQADQRSALLDFEHGGCVQLLKDRRKGGGS